MYNSKSPKYKRSRKSTPIIPIVFYAIHTTPSHLTREQWTELTPSQATISTAPFQPRLTSRASSLRRLKIISLLFVVSITLILFYRSSTSSSHSVSADFYHKTKTALDLDKEDHTSHKKPSSKAEAVAEALGSKVGEVKEDTKQRLQDAAKEAKDKANAKAPKPDNPASIIGVGSAEEGGVGSAASGKGVSEPGSGGRKKWNTGDDKQTVVKEDEKESDEDHEVEVELNSILKKAPGMYLHAAPNILPPSSLHICDDILYSNTPCCDTRTNMT